MANIKTKTLADGKTKAYLVRWVDPDGNHRSKQFARQKDAKDHAADVNKDLRRGSYIDPDAGNITFKAYAEQWRSNQLHRENTESRVRNDLEHHIYPIIGNRKLKTLRRSDIQALVSRLHESGALQPSTIAIVYTRVVGVLNAAVWDKLILETPARRITLPSIDNDEISIPTTRQVLSMAAAVPERFRALVLAAATTGLRQGELCGLTLPEVDFLGQARHVRVRRQLITPDKGPIYIGPLKTIASKRDVPLADEAATALAEHLRKWPAREHTIPTKEQLERGDPRESWSTWQLIFTGSNNAPVRRATVGNVLRPVLAAHGFPPGSGLHLFRHFYASALIADGRSVKVVQSRLGHATATETLNTYSHLWPDDEDRSRKAIDGTFERARQAEQGARDEAADGASECADVDL